MKRKKPTENPASTKIGQKVLVAVLLSIFFFAAAIYITKFAFFEVNESISRFSDTNPKNKALNEIYSAFADFERNYQAPLIADPFENTDAYYFKLDTLNKLISSTLQTVPFRVSEVTLLDSVQKMILRQDGRLMAYRAYKRMEKPLLKQNLDSLINLLSTEQVLLEADVITTLQTTRRITADPIENEVEKDEKKGFLSRLFASNSEKKKPLKEELPKDTIEETYITIDTVPLAKGDTSNAKAGTIIKDIRRNQAYQANRVREVEMDIVQNSARIQNFMLSLIRGAEEIELARIRDESEAASGMMQNALSQMYLVLGIFAILAIFLVFRILSDLSKAKYYRLQLVEEKERAENLSKVKERFLANMSHEIRTPLQNILGSSEKLVGEAKNRDAEIIHQSSEHLLQIVNQVLDFSRISTGKLTLNPLPTKLKSLLLEVVNSMSIQASKKDIRIFFESEIQQDMVFVDPFRLRQILYNLLGNSIKFTEEGFIKLFAKTENQADNKVRFSFSIEDSGVGMTEHELESVFNEFEQAGTPMQASNGTGLGLSITKALVEAHQGKINVKSTKDQGTVFNITLLLPSIPVQTETEVKVETRPKMNSVLVVDDDETILNLTHQILEKNGIHVVSESSPLRAIEVAKKQHFDMALVDFRMPEMTGAELSAKLKEINPNLPVVAITANVFSKEMDETKKGHFDSYLPKPYKARELLKLVGCVADEKKGESNSNALATKLDKLTFGDAKLAADLMEQFKTDCRSDLSNLQTALAKNNGEDILDLVHKLSGRLSFFEFDELAAGYKNIERSLEREASSEASPETIEPLNQELVNILNQI